MVLIAAFAPIYFTAEIQDEDGDILRRQQITDRQLRTMLTGRRRFTERQVSVLIAGAHQTDIRLRLSSGNYLIIKADNIDHGHPEWTNHE